MKVIAINGSPKDNGNTYSALKVMADELAKESIETEIITIGSKAIHGCVGCGYCANHNGMCIFGDDILNETAEKMRNADGIIIGSPVYYAGMNGTLKCFLDRAFYTSSAAFKYKPCAAVAALRRSGGVATFDSINHYFNLAQMIITPSMYWNVAHGQKNQEVLSDEEGIQILKMTAKNMAWLLKMLDESKAEKPRLDEDKVRTNFIR